MSELPGGASDSFDDLIAGLELDLPESTQADMILFLGGVINHLDEGVRSLMEVEEDRPLTFALWGLKICQESVPTTNMLLTIALHALTILSMDYIEESTADITLPELINGMLAAHVPFRAEKNSDIETFWFTFSTNVIPTLEATGEMGDEFRALVRLFWDISDPISKCILIFEVIDLTFEIISFLNKNFYAHLSLFDVWGHFISNFRTHHTAAVEGNYE